MCHWGLTYLSHVSTHSSCPVANPNPSRDLNLTLILTHRGRTGNTTTATGYVLPSTRSNTYNMTTFLLKYLSYDYPSLPGEG